MTPTVLTVNPGFGVLKKQADALLFSLYGEVKLLRGAVRLIDHILDNVDEHRMKPELLQFVAQSYPQDAAAKILDQMIATGILMEDGYRLGAAETDARQGIAQRFGCLGSGRLAEAVQSLAEPLPFIRLGDDARTEPSVASELADLAAWTAFFEARLDAQSLSALAVCPENMNYLKLSALNRACITLRLPWVLGYFNGGSLILGPTVIPLKTPCLECLSEHRLRALDPALGIGREDFMRCVENHPFPAGESWEGSIRWTAWLMVEEMKRLISSQSPPMYMKRQIQIPRLAVPQMAETLFEPITTCPACQGLNLGYMAAAPATAPNNPGRVEISLSQNEVRHRDNGLRALDAEDARAMLDRALALLKTTVNIRLCRGGMLDDIIPSFRSSTSTFYSPELPFTVYARKHWGKGLNERQAYLSAGFELVERICSEYSGQIEMLQCPYSQVKDHALDLKFKVGKQYYLRNVDSTDMDTAIDWVWGRSILHNKNVLVPASMVFLTRSVFQGKFTLNFSTGLAAGTTMEDAILQGLLEVVEHDSRYIWQANPVITPRVTRLPVEIQNIAAQLRALGCELIVRDHRTDLGIYVFRAWIVQPDNPVNYAASGLGASLNPKIALFRAITEAKQAWPSERQASAPYFASKSNTDLFGYNTPAIFCHYQDNITEIMTGGPEVAFDSLPDLSTGDILRDIHATMERIVREIPGSDIIVVNLTREVFGIPAVRVIVSGLQNASQPLQNFPGDRLFIQPVKLGYSDKRLSFKELYNDNHQQ